MTVGLHGGVLGGVVHGVTVGGTGAHVKFVSVLILNLINLQGLTGSDSIRVIS